MKKIIVFLAVLIALSTCLCACSDSKAIQKKLCESDWVFNWDGLQTETYKFNSDGTYKLTITSTLFNKVEQTGTYTISDEQIELVRDNDSYKSTMSYTYEDGTLTLTCRNKTVSK